MKKTTCKAMGGACDEEIQGETADELMANGKQHVHDAAETGDEDHKSVIQKMEQMSEEDRKKWAEELTNNFDALEDV